MSVVEIILSCVVAFLAMGFIFMAFAVKDLRNELEERIEYVGRETTKIWTRLYGLHAINDVELTEVVSLILRDMNKTVGRAPQHAKLENVSQKK